jgi:hypothetical protein
MKAAFPPVPLVLRPTLPVTLVVSDIGIGGTGGEGGIAAHADSSAIGDVACCCCDIEHHQRWMLPNRPLLEVKVASPPAPLVLRPTLPVTLVVSRVISASAALVVKVALPPTAHAPLSVMLPAPRSNAEVAIEGQATG